MFYVKAVVEWRGASAWHLMVAGANGIDRALISFSTEVEATEFADELNALEADDGGRQPFARLLIPDRV